MNYFALFTLHVCLFSEVYASDQSQSKTLAFNNDLNDGPRKRSIYTRHKRKPTPYVENEFLDHQETDILAETKGGFRAWLKSLFSSRSR
jgi:hypothetical protein